MEKKQYRKKERQEITAVQINLETDGMRYHKWGSDQQCQSGDWLVDNNGDCYTISNESFAATYEPTAPGRYVKSAPVWAVQVSCDGKVKTNEGYTEYVAGDYLVSNDIDAVDTYAVSKNKFEDMYELIE